MWPFGCERGCESVVSDSKKAVIRTPPSLYRGRGCRPDYDCCPGDLSDLSVPLVSC